MRKFYFTLIALVASLAVNAQTSKEYVDLGLPSGTLWATCNVGAEAPEELGDFFAWGETEPKEKYEWGNYKWCTKATANYKWLSKYRIHIDDVDDFMDNKNVLDPEDDAAIANWGSEWCMPSFDQINELMNSKYTTSKWTTQNGVKGRLITSKSNNNTIFLPAAGYRSSTWLEKEQTGFYWCNLHVDDPSSARAYLILFTQGYIKQYNNARNLGGSVRPVRAKVTTSINGVVANQEAAKDGKYIIGGKLVIVKDGKKYNANGIEIK